MTWKAAIATAWKLRGVRHIYRSLFVASIGGITSIAMSGLVPGLVTWVLLAAAMFVIHVVDDARVQRKDSRKEARRVSA